MEACCLKVLNVLLLPLLPLPRLLCCRCLMCGPAGGVGDQDVEFCVEEGDDEEDGSDWGPPPS